MVVKMYRKEVSLCFVKLKLYGQLAEFVGHKEFEIEVNSVSQAVSFLIHNFPEVRTLYES